VAVAAAGVAVNAIEDFGAIHEIPDVLLQRVEWVLSGVHGHFVLPLA
jgi:hypothetical protein